MSKRELIEKVKEIMSGIDKTETESDDGWWETTFEAEFGGEKLEELIALIEAEVK